MADELELEATEPSVHSHPLDPISLAFGAIFTLVGAVFLFTNVNVADLDLGSLVAAMFGAVGVLLFAIGFRRQRRNRAEVEAP